VTIFHDFPFGPRDREWDGAAAEKRVRAWAGAGDGPDSKSRRAHLVRRGRKQNFTAYKLFTGIVNGHYVAVPRAVIAAGNILGGAHGGIDLPQSDITRIMNHLANYHKKMGEIAPWERD
jgi:hypothetical protein